MKSAQSVLTAPRGFYDPGGCSGSQAVGLTYNVIMCLLSLAKSWWAFSVYINRLFILFKQHSWLDKVYRSP